MSRLLARIVIDSADFMESCLQEAVRSKRSNLQQVYACLLLFLMTPSL